MEFLYVVSTSLLSVAALFVITKLMGHKQLSQLSFFDYISGITVGSVGAELATELEKPWKPLTALVVYGAVSVALSLVMSKIPDSRKYINGSPTIILDAGKLYRKNIKKAKIDLSEFLVMCRELGYFDLNDIQTAVLETNGCLSVLPKSEKRPATPSDLQLCPKPSHIQTEVIMDGRVLEENLKRMGLNSVWLNKELNRQGYKGASEILLGMCDADNTLTLFADN